MAQLLTFFSEKGGTGKTSLTMLTANYLSYNPDVHLKVCIFDADQSGNLAGCRTRDVLNMSEERKQSIYPVYEVPRFSEDNRSAMVKYIAWLNELKENEDYDFIFIDLPGNVNDYFTKNFILSDILDLMIVVCEPEPQTVFSDLRLIRALINNPAIKIQFPIYLLWNKCHTRRPQAYYDYYNNVFRGDDITVLDTRIRLTTDFSNEALRNTVKYSQSFYERNNLITLYNEIFE